MDDDKNKAYQKKSLYISEKASVAMEFSKALGYKMERKDGYLESPEAVITWCVGHLVTMSYPEAYDEAYKKWSYNMLPFIPQEYKYEVIKSSKKQFGIVSKLLRRRDVSVIYVCTDSGREGEYIYRLVEQMAGVTGKERRRVWIDSQTEEEILRGIREAKPLSEYDRLSDAAYLRAQEDYLMGINFSRALTLKCSSSIKSCMGLDKAVLSVGRVMTCVLGMVVDRERQIRSFVKTPYYKITGKFTESEGGVAFSADWQTGENSLYKKDLYKDNGFLKREDAEEFLEKLSAEPVGARLIKLEKKEERKAAPLLYNLAELQNDCARIFHISPDQTLQVAQELYEKKLTTYPRTDARVLSSAVAKVIRNNISGLSGYVPVAGYVNEVLQSKTYEKIASTKYVNDKLITDHYAIIPTGQGLSALQGLSEHTRGIYDLIVRRFLSVFFGPAIYYKAAALIVVKTPQIPAGEEFVFNAKVLAAKGYMEVSGVPEREKEGAELWNAVSKLKEGDYLQVERFFIKDGETTPPKRYNSGSLILAMENAGQLIEDEELRAQIKGSGIGTSATRAEILKKLVTIGYLTLNKKTQVMTTALYGEMVYEAVADMLNPLLSPKLTASWEKGLSGVAEGTVTPEEYRNKLEGFVCRRTEYIKMKGSADDLCERYDELRKYYR